MPFTTSTPVRGESLPAPEGTTERRDLRTTHSKTFVGDDALSHTCQVMLGPVCYRDDDGSLRSIDTTIRVINGGTGVEWAPYKFTLHATGIGFDFLSRDGGFARVALVGIGGARFDTTMSYAPEVDSNVVTFRSVRPGCDIVFKCLNSQVKTVRILSDENSPREFIWLCEHDEEGRDKIGERLFGSDIAQRPLDLAVRIDDIGTHSFHAVETWSGFTTVRDPRTRIKSLSSDVSYPVQIDPTVSYDITSDDDDATEYMQFGGSHFGGYFGFNYLGSAIYSKRNALWRFQGVAVPQGATITSASLNLNVTSSTGAGGGGDIYGVDLDNMTTSWTGYGYDTTGLSATSSSEPLARTTATGPVQFVATSPVQEIINRGGWSSGNSLGLFAITSEVSPTSNRTFFEDYHDGGADPPQLSITYTAAPPGSLRRLPVVISQAVNRASRF